MMACRRGQPRIGQSRTPIWFCGIVSDCIICRVRKIIQCSLALRAASHLRRQAFLIKIRLLTCRPSRTRRAVARIRLRAYEADKTGIRSLHRKVVKSLPLCHRSTSPGRQRGYCARPECLPEKASLIDNEVSSQCPGTSAPVRTGVARISYYVALATITFAAFFQKKPHDFAQRHQP